MIVIAAGHIACGGPTAVSDFRTGMVHAQDPQRLIALTELINFLATSGPSERRQQLYNPFTRKFATAILSASVSGTDLGLCDALATALSVGRHDVMVLIEHIAEHGALTFDSSGVMLATPNFA